MIDAMDKLNATLDVIQSASWSRCKECSLRAACTELTVTNVPAAHWLPLGKKGALVQTTRSWVQIKKLIEGGTQRPEAMFFRDRCDRYKGLVREKFEGVSRSSDHK